MSEKEKLRKLVRGIILTQGNVYIKELLRKQDIKIGATKLHFQKNMESAIDSGKLSLNVLEEWLQEVEGWGDQHVYVYSLPTGVPKENLWKNRKNVEDIVKQKGLNKVWEASSSMAFPEELELTEIFFDGNVFRAVWHEKLISWMRQTDKDYRKKEEDDDLYEYRAYRERPKRSVVRFEWIKDKNTAVIFLHSSFEGSTHKNIIQKIFDVIRFFFNTDSFTLVDISSIIKKLDQKALTTAGANSPISSQDAIYSTGGASIEFRSMMPDAGYNKVEAIRRVRRAVETDAFSGEVGVFIFEKEGLSNISRNIKVQLYGKQNRIRFSYLCTREDVWLILDYIKQ